MAKLEDRVALVTGSGRGIGAATAKLLAREGAKIVVNDLDAEAAESTANAIAAAGGAARACVGDLTAAGFPERLIAFASDAFGALDIVVNNAGYVWNSAMHKHTDE